MKSKRIRSKKFSRGFLPTIGVLFLIGFSVFYYWARINNSFGLKRFVDFSLEQCREPLVLVPQKRIIDVGTIKSWRLIKDEESGFQIYAPKEWVLDKSCGAPLCLNSPNLLFSDNGTIIGSRISITRYPKIESLPDQSWSAPSSYISLIKKIFSCTYVDINGNHAVVQHNAGEKNRNVYYIQGETDNYILIEQVWTPNLTDDTDKIINSFQSTFSEEKMVGDTGPYNGIPSPRVPYKQLTFQDIDIHEKKQVSGIFPNLNKPGMESMVGYTFIANKNDFIEFRMLVPGSINMMNNVSLELYSYGPTILKKENILEWRVPLTGRYFIVLKNAMLEADREFSLLISISR